MKIDVRGNFWIGKEFESYGKGRYYVYLEASYSVPVEGVREFSEGERRKVRISREDYYVLKELMKKGEAIVDGSLELKVKKRD